MHRAKLEFVLHDNYAKEGLNCLIHNTSLTPTIAIEFAKISQASPLLYG